MRLAVPHKVLGIVFLCLLLLGVWLTYAVFTKKFADYDEVTLQTSKIGLQLPSRADVKVRGVIVGEVLEFEANRRGRRADPRPLPGEIDSIPSDVTGSIVPKTLFGEKYVSLEVPEGSTADEPLAGRRPHRAHRGLDRGRGGALRPLPAAAHGPARRAQHDAQRASRPRSRGAARELGENLETLDSYLKRLNPQIPAHRRRPAPHRPGVRHLRRRDARDREILRNTITTTGTFEDQGRQGPRALRGRRRLLRHLARLLDANGDNLIRLGELGAQQLRVFTKYAPEYPCLTGGDRQRRPAQAEAFRGFTLHIVLETMPEPAARLRRRPTSRATARPAAPTASPAEPALEPGNPVRHQPTSTTASTADRQGHQPGPAARLHWRRYGYAGTPAERPVRACWHRPRRQRRRTSPTSGRSWWDRWPAARR